MINYVFERYEKKYLINQKQFDAINSELKNHMVYDPYCPNGKIYTIYNLYFDTFQNDIIRACILNPEYKEKVRIRSYKVPEENDLIFLEVKRKTKGKTSKRRISLTEKEANDFFTNNIKPLRKNYNDLQIINELDYYFKTNHVNPIVFLRYDRLAYANDTGLRITFDNNLISRRSNINLHDTSGTNLLSDGVYIMEIKIPTAIPMWLVKLLSDQKVYSQGFSKYGYDFQNYAKGEVNNG